MTLCRREQELVNIFNNKSQTPDELNDLLSQAWLGIYTNNDTLYNPLTNMSSISRENFPQYMAWLMSRPEYFYFIMRDIFQMGSFPTQCMVLKELYNHRFPMMIGSRGWGKTTALGLYLLVAMLTRPGIKCVVTGAGFRQAKVVFETMENVWKKSNVLQSCFKGDKNGPSHGTDVWTFRMGDSICYALPVGHDGSKIRGYRANILACDEMASMNRQVFEEVMGPFLVVAADPLEQMKNSSKVMLSKRMGNKMDNFDLNLVDILNNQLILSGTAYYQHNHFYAYYKKWTNIIASAGDPEILKGILGEDFSKDFDWTQYSVMRVPVDLISAGFMDMSQIGRIKASTTKDIYLREFGTVFTNDSTGFFRRSLIDSCTVASANIISKYSEESDSMEVVEIAPRLHGDPNKKYVYGVDPAYEGDNFAIVILECEPTYRKIVHVWTTQSSDHKKLVEDGVVTENDYYHYCVRKIRNLMKRFPCSYIALDSQGGGKAILEGFKDTTKLEGNENMILPVIDPTQKPKDTDHLLGDHIVHVVNFTNDWIVEANHALKKDMEQKDLIFPYYDDINYAMASFYDDSLGQHSTLYDTLEDCLYEIEELKKELTMIVVTETSTGRQRFDTPETKIGISQKGRLHKDRYSALLLANYVARSAESLVTRMITPDVFSMGGFAGSVGGRHSGPLFLGNNNIANKFQQLYNSQKSVITEVKK